MFHSISRGNGEKEKKMAIPVQLYRIDAILVCIETQKNVQHRQKTGSNTAVLYLDPRVGRTRDVVVCTTFLWRPCKPIDGVLASGKSPKDAILRSRRYHRNPVPTKYPIITIIIRLITLCVCVSGSVRRVVGVLV